jgi:hypothetical protein
VIHQQAAATQVTEAVAAQPVSLPACQTSNIREQRSIPAAKRLKVLPAQLI